MDNTFLDWFSQGFEVEESLVYEGVIHLQFYIIRAKLKRMKWRCPHCVKKNTVLLKECLHCGGILLEDPLQ